MHASRVGGCVNAIAPGVFRTALNEKLLDETERGREFLMRTPMRRFGNVEELADEPCQRDALLVNRAQGTLSSVGIRTFWALELLEEELGEPAQARDRRLQLVSCHRQELIAQAQGSLGLGARVTLLIQQPCPLNRHSGSLAGQLEEAHILLSELARGA